MNIFRIILGIIVVALGLGMASAAWAIAIYGQWTATINISIGVVLAFFGFGIVWSGIMLMTGATVRDALGGIVNALQGHGGVGLHKGNTYYIPPTGIKDILLDIFRYAIIALVVILIAIFSVGRVINLPIGG